MPVGSILKVSCPYKFHGLCFPRIYSMSYFPSSWFSLLSIICISVIDPANTLTLHNLFIYFGSSVVNFWIFYNLPYLIPFLIWHLLSLNSSPTFKFVVRFQYIFLIICLLFMSHFWNALTNLVCITRSRVFSKSIKHAITSGLY